MPSENVVRIILVTLIVAVIQLIVNRFSFIFFFRKLAAAGFARAQSGKYFSALIQKTIKERPARKNISDSVPVLFFIKFYLFYIRHG